IPQTPKRDSPSTPLPEDDLPEVEARILSSQTAVPDRCQAEGYFGGRSIRHSRRQNSSIDNQSAQTATPDSSSAQRPRTRPSPSPVSYRVNTCPGAVASAAAAGNGVRRGAAANAHGLFETANGLLAPVGTGAGVAVSAVVVFLSASFC